MMRNVYYFHLRILLIVVTFSWIVSLGSGFSKLTLHKAYPNDKPVNVNEVQTRDWARYSRLAGVVDFPLGGYYDPFFYGFYYATLKIGSPPQEFHVHIDTGSDVTWISCTGCSGCPNTSGLTGSDPNFFDASKSSTIDAVLCSDKRCKLGARYQESACDHHANKCSYKMQYGDGSKTSGFYLSDVLHLNVAFGSNVTQMTNKTAPIVFGCSTKVAGVFTEIAREFPSDGLLGLGRTSISAISQLSSKGIVPPVFSHCLRGDMIGGGTLVFGEIINPDMVYSPLSPHQSSYILYMEGVSIKGQSLPNFTTSNNMPTLIDSGTTLAYFPEAIYTPLHIVINNIVSQLEGQRLPNASMCYKISRQSSVDHIFPTISLNFKGGAPMLLRPRDYLLQRPMVDGKETWCLGLLKAQDQSLAILGDIVLKNRAVVYDISQERIGWVTYDCSRELEVNATVMKSNTTRIKPFVKLRAVITAFLLMHFFDL